MASDRPIGTDGLRNLSRSLAGRCAKWQGFLEGSSLDQCTNRPGRDARRFEASRLHDPVCRLECKTPGCTTGPWINLKIKNKLLSLAFSNFTYDTF